MASTAVCSSSTSLAASMCVGPCGSVSATRNARRTHSCTFSTFGMLYAHLVIGRMNVVWSMSCVASRSRITLSCTPQMLITGTRPRYAAPIAVARLVTPGPSVAVTTAGRRPARAKPYAMNAAPCSWRVRMKRICGVSRSASMIARFCVPGMPNTWSTPSRSSASTSARAPVTVPILLFSVESIATAPLSAGARRPG